MDDDLNTAQALGYLFDAVRLINRLMEEPSDHPGLSSRLCGRPTTPWRTWARCRI